MKILVLNPFVDASHEIVLSLQKKGFAVLVSSDSKEAAQMLQVHGASVDLWVIHREDAQGQGEPGLELVKKLKANPQFQNIPFVLSTAVWKDAQCVQHQGTDLGANAYLPWPFNSAALSQLVDAVLGPATAPSVTAAPSATSLTAGTGSFSLESADVIFNQPLTERQGTASIMLEAPDHGGTNPGVESDFAKPEEDAATKVLQDMLMPALDEPVAAEEVVAVAPPSEPVAPGTTVAPGLSPPPSAEKAAPAAPGGEGIAINLDSVAGLENAEIETSGQQGSVSVASAPAAVSQDDALVIQSTQVPVVSASSAEIPAEVPAVAVPPAAGSAFDPSLLKLDDEPESSSSASIPDMSMSSIAAEQQPQNLETQSQASVQPPIDSQAAAEMPYLYSSKKSGLPHEAGFPVSVGDAIVPGGAAQAPDSETLKKYLMLRESDVSSLSAQLHAAMEQLRAGEDMLRVEKARAAELAHIVNEQKKKIEELEQSKQAAVESIQRETEDLKFQLKTKVDKAKVMERQVQEAIEDLEKVKERVRIDIRKIRVREKELENRLEIMKKDSEVLLISRESKIVELKRKVDLLEFNMDLLQDQLSKEKDAAIRLRDKLIRGSQAIRLAGGLLDASGNVVFDTQAMTHEVTITATDTAKAQQAESSAATVVMESTPTEVTKRAS